jgi:hypothetical protein
MERFFLGLLEGLPSFMGLINVLGGQPREIAFGRLLTHSYDNDNRYTTHHNRTRGATRYDACAFVHRFARVRGEAHGGDDRNVTRARSSSGTANGGRGKPR